MKQKDINIAESGLIKRLIKGEQNAFAELFEKYAANLLAISNSYLDNEEDAREIVQETFYRVWKYRKNMNPELSFKAYIITISKRLIFNRARKRMHEIAYQEYFIKHHMQSRLVNNIENYINFQELDQKIKKGIAALPPKCQQIFLLSRQNGLNNKEIAEKLNISLSTVENQMNKALKFLREAITIISILILS